jgi:hypothetical protein
MSKPQIIRSVGLPMQLCVPDEWTDEQVIAFAEKENPAGTENGWVVVKDGDPILKGAKSRLTCGSDGDNIHIVVTV